MINSIRLRKLIGWLSFWLSIVLCAILRQVPESISITYYTYAAPIFIITLGAASTLLIAYMGYDYRDDILNTVAGMAGFGILLFPCWNGSMEIVGVF